MSALTIAPTPEDRAALAEFEYRHPFYRAGWMTGLIDNADSAIIVCPGSEAIEWAAYRRFQGVVLEHLQGIKDKAVFPDMKTALDAILRDVTAHSQC